MARWSLSFLKVYISRASQAADAMYEDTPVVARPCGSELEGVTGDDVEALTVRPERPLAENTLVRPLESSGCAFSSFPYAAPLPLSLSLS